VFNGEIFNYAELKAKLEAKQHKFSTNSDSEVLVHLYEEYKEKMLDYLDSEMYAFVIYDTTNNSYFAARDKIGVKPLYWAENNGVIYFASEMKQLIQFSNIQQINNLMPGHYINNGVIRKYSNLIDKKKFTKENIEKIAEKLRQLLHSAVKKRVQTDLPIGVFLSGGLDSTTILSIAGRYNKNITAVCVGKRDSSDLYHAKKYCEEFGIPYKVAEPPSEKNLEKEIEKIIYITETFEPNVIRNSMISYYISKLGKDFRVILCGEGADEIFFGYPEFENSNEDDGIELDFLKDLHRTQCQRVDRTSMHFTEEVRVPFLDSALIEYALSIPKKYKIKDGTTKWILRKAMEKELPDYIRLRKKIVLAEGAGYRGNKPDKGMFDDFIKKRMTDEEFIRITVEFSEWNIKTKEEAYYFKIFRKIGFDKGKFAKKRPRVNRVQTIDNDVLETLKSKSFSRYKPYKIDESNGDFDRFVMFWGTLGKVVVDDEDIKSIEFLKKFKGKLENKLDKNIEIKVMLADAHAQMNGIDSINAYTYLQNIKEVLESNGFTTIYLSSLWKQWGIDLERIKSEKDMYQIDNPKLGQILIRASKRYFKGNPAEGYKMYYAMRKIESKYLFKDFSGYIFLTYNSPIFIEILPDMPTLYIHAKEGYSKPPWISYSIPRSDEE
jgi:asparagine synthase (glutamine-hydrolysing)